VNRPRRSPEDTAGVPIPSELTGIHDALRADRQQLLDRVARLAELGDGGHDEHAATVALRALLVDVDSALDKVAQGSYGRCEVCAGVIAPARLQALPHATRCVQCT
jgi:hypothetical protein